MLLLLITFLLVATILQLYLVFRGLGTIVIILVRRIRIKMRCVPHPIIATAAHHLVLPTQIGFHFLLRLRLRLLLLVLEELGEILVVLLGHLVLEACVDLPSGVRLHALRGRRRYGRRLVFAPGVRCVL